jgi:hypothetical protein
MGIFTQASGPRLTGPDKAEQIKVLPSYRLGTVKCSDGLYRFWAYMPSERKLLILGPDADISKPIMEIPFEDLQSIFAGEMNGC